MMCRKDVKKATYDELSEELEKPEQAFTDTFLRKNGFNTITKNGSKLFKNAVEWRFCGLSCVMREHVMREHAPAYYRKPRRAMGWLRLVGSLK